MKKIIITLTLAVCAFAIFMTIQSCKGKNPDNSDCTPPPSPTVTGKTKITTDDSLKLSCAPVLSGHFKWTFPNGNTDTNRTIAIAHPLISDAGNYKVTVTVDGCESAPVTKSVAIVALAKVAWVDDNGKAWTVTLFPEDMKNADGELFEWSSPGHATIITAATSSDNGIYNTGRIVTVQGKGNYAAYTCDTLSQLGHTDWYLPAKEEIQNIYVKRTTAMGFANLAYWTSSEQDKNYAWYIDFATGNIGIDQPKTNGLMVRCVRHDAL